MSRLHLIVCLCAIQFGALGQSKLTAFLKHAEEKHKAGDFYYAVELLEKAMELDSNSINVLWKYAESLRAYKDYRKAEYYYKRVYAQDASSAYPMSFLYVGLMQKQNGKYADAIETFKRVKSKFGKDKKGYIYLKAKRELESTLWAQTALKDTVDIQFYSLPGKVNSPDAEFGHTISGTSFIFSSLKADSVSSNEEVYGSNYTTQLYTGQLINGSIDSIHKMDDLVSSGMNTGNGAFSLDGSRFYYSLCESSNYNYRCKLMVARFSDGTWSKPDSLGPIINVPGKNTTMPAIGKLDGNEVLFFASDRNDGVGTMDLWYSIIKDGNSYSKPKNIKTLNSIDQEVSPHWDEAKQRLYFSSNWHDGFGGFDVFYSQYKGSGSFEKPINVGIPINSPANDLYYFSQNDTSYVSSNREGVNFSKNPTCCSDIFTAVPFPIPTVPELSKTETLIELSKRLPVTLYFHNDCPDPRSKDTITKVNYINGYDEYRELLDKYQQEYSAGLSTDKSNEAKEDIENFFIEYVDKGVSDLKLFEALLMQELQRGAKIRLTVKGFASPLAKTDYNVNLTKRRISSLINYLSASQNGVFLPFFNGSAENGGRLYIQEVPFGEYTANKLTSDNFHDQKNSVYSRAAAIERKIEIQRVEFLEEDSLSFITEIYPHYIDLKTINRQSTGSRKLKLTNQSNAILNIERIELDTNVFSVNSPNFIEARQEEYLTISIKGQLPEGLFSLPIKLYFVGYKEPLIVTINGEGKDQ